jgi:hypothetical protein
VAGKKEEEVAGKSEVNQVPVRAEKKAVAARLDDTTGIECGTMA